MSSSFIHFRGHGFWSHDDLTECLIGGVAAAILEGPDAKPWLKELAAHWRLQASGPFRAWMHLELDVFVTVPERLVELRGIVRAVTGKLPSDDPIRQTGDLLVKLLDGEIVWDASSPLDYMVGLSAPERNRRR